MASKDDTPSDGLSDSGSGSDTTDPSEHDAHRHQYVAAEVDPAERVRTRRQPRAVWKLVDPVLRHRRTVFVAAASLLMLSATVVSIVIIPPIWASTLPGLTAVEQAAAQDSMRETVVQAGGGLLLIFGFYFTARTLQLNREANLTERFTNAVGQLGSRNADVRVGAIFALERISRDSSTDHAVIVDLLVSFLSHHVRIPTARRANGDGNEDHGPEPDAQAAVTVLARRPGADREHARIRLRNLDLTGIRARNANFAYVDFGYSILDHVSFRAANLFETSWFNSCARDSTFLMANLQGADFAFADATATYFCGADLADASFRGARLDRADFSGLLEPDGTWIRPPAAVRDADFTDASLVGCKLSDVDLSTCTGLTSDQLAQAALNERTRLPPYLLLPRL